MKSWSSAFAKKPLRRSLKKRGQLFETVLFEVWGMKPPIISGNYKLYSVLSTQNVENKSNGLVHYWWP